MPGKVMNVLQRRLEAEFERLTSTETGLYATVDARYGELPLRVEHDPNVSSLRVSVTVAPPAGAGPEFLVWCLTTNAQYWDVKLGLDDDGLLAVHADVEIDEAGDMDAAAQTVVDRAATIIGLLDDDLVQWLLAHSLGTPVQRERWRTRAKYGSEH